MCFCLSIYLPVLWHAGAEERSIQAQNTISISRRCYQRLAGAWWLTDHWGRKWFEHKTLSSVYLQWRKYNLEHWLLSRLENICWVLRMMAWQILTNIKYIGIHLAWKIADICRKIISGRLFSIINCFIFDWTLRSKKIISNQLEKLDCAKKHHQWHFEKNRN